MCADVVASLYPSGERPAGLPLVGAITLTAPSSIVTERPRPPVGSVRLRTQVSEIAGIETGAVRIKRGQHPVDSALDQLVVIDWLDVSPVDPLIDCHKLAELEARSGHRRRRDRRWSPAARQRH
jgi:hypothetical protein